MTEKSKTRKPTTAERYAARLAGRDEHAKIEVEARTTAQLHYDRLRARQAGEPPAAA
ncbi:hypothetical protein ACFYY2_29770 [Streptomyces sp. NPDC001822]|uniref:hypothetical protein n=1 Tax=Streptomyces sp. NPDC001822 TaxID=3364614 RepID=UPI003693EF65